MKKTENQKSRSKSIALRIKPDTELSRVYEFLAANYETDSDMLKDALWALVEKKHPNRMDVQLIEKKVLIE